MRTLTTICALLIAACGGEGEGSGDAGAGQAGEMRAEPPASAPTERRVEIASPSEGSTVEGPEVTVELAAYGFEVVEAGDTTANTGHHHLFLDRDVSAAEEPIPAEEGFIVHMGDGSTTFTFSDVEPGDHRLIAVVGDGYHVPVPGLVDTVTFTVR